MNGAWPDEEEIGGSPGKYMGALSHDFGDSRASLVDLPSKVLWCLQKPRRGRVLQQEMSNLDSG